MPLLRTCLPIAWICLAVLFAPCAAGAWERLDRGLWLEEFSPPGEPGVPGVSVLRIDPRYWRLTLRSASETGFGPRTVREWAEERHLAAVINASMYRADDPVSSTGYMKNFEHENNPSRNAHFGAFLVFNPKEEGLPQARVLDRARLCPPDVLSRYDTVVQNYRILSADRQNVWKGSGQAHGITAVAEDGEGRILFIYSEGQRPIRELGEILLALPLDIRTAMYTEGGTEASLYVSHGGRTGIWSAGARKGPGSTAARELWPVPNVLGIEKIELSSE